MSWTAPRRLYLTADHSRVVDGESAEAAFLLVGEGGQIPLEEARQYGLLAEAKAIELGDQVDGAVIEDKAVKPAASKAARPARK